MTDVVSRLRVMSFMICGEAADTIEAQAERIRVLREALERLDGQCHGEREVSAVFVRKVCRAALDATK